MGIELIARAAEHRNAIAIIDDRGSHTYGELLDASARLAGGLLGDQPDLEESRIGFLVPPGFDYVATQWAIWRAGGIAVPLATMHPPLELEYVVDDTAAASLIVDPALADRLRSIATARSLELRDPTELVKSPIRPLPDVDPARRAMILYTSGTTSRPKGVVTTHENVQSQITVLVDAWGWEAADHILNVLPLHHVHGIINVLCCALWAGACCEFQAPFDPHATWQRIADGDLTLFMAVPTIYAKLIHTWGDSDPERQKQLSDAAATLRLMVSGSAALPVPTLERWQQMTGQVLLERYGMTEIGMALSNPLRGERRPGHVGVPLSNIEVRRVDEAGKPVLGSEPGEIEVRGPGVFAEYWGRAKETEEAFRQGWFRTGDVAVVEEGAYRILGRNSVDIIKTGGYKVSALEIEDVLSGHPQVRECAVVGVDDEEWGEKVAACLVTEDHATLTLESLREWTQERLAPYKVPRLLILADELPRNAMGKVQKPAVAAQFKTT